MNSIRTTAIAAALTAVLASAPASAGGDYPSQGKGVGIGTALGALVAGPAGAVFGAIGGAFVGYQQDLENQVAERDRRVAAAERELAEVRTALVRLQDERTALDERLAQAEVAALAVEPAAGDLFAWAEGVSISYGFRTGSGELEPVVRRQIERLARTLAAQPQLLVAVDGYADARGGTGINERLSLARANAVAAALEAGGVGADRISVRAHGVVEEPAPVADREGLFFDRKAVITLHPLQK